MSASRHRTGPLLATLLAAAGCSEAAGHTSGTGGGGNATGGAGGQGAAAGGAPAGGGAGGASSSSSGFGPLGGGAPHPGNDAACPEVRPDAGTDCPEGLSCLYASGCDPAGCDLRCIAGSWVQSCTPCEGPAPACPSEAPFHGAPCQDAMAWYSWCLYDRCDPDYDFGWAQCDGETWQVNHSLCASPSPGCYGVASGEEVYPCFGNVLCPHTSASPDCTPHPDWYSCAANPCTHQPLSCACAGVLCGPFMQCTGVDPKGQVQCEPLPPGPNPKQTLVSGGAGQLVISEQHAFYTTAPNDVRRVPLAGGPDELFASPSGRLAIGPDYLYVAEQPTGTLRRVSLTTQSEGVLATGLPWLASLTVNSQIAVWGTTTETYRVPIDGGTATLLTPFSGIVALDEDSAFLATSSGFYAVPFSGGGWSLILSAGIYAKQMTNDATHLYFTQWTAQPSEGRVWRVPKTGGPAQQLASNQYHPTAIVADDTHVYFSRDDSYIMRVPKTGGATEVVVAGAYKPDYLAIDDTHLYWAAPAAPCGGVFKIAKLP